jgi:hypothetical protein
MDDDGRGADLGRRVAGLLQDLPRPVADVVLGRADVDQVRGVDVEGQLRLEQLRGVIPRGRLLPPLGVREEDL